MSNIAPFDQLNRVQRLALISIVSGDSLSQAAAAARVTDRTVRNWRKQPIFQEALAAARRDFFSACRSHMNESLAVAFHTLLRTAGSSWSDSERLKAALSLLDRVAHTEISAIPLPENDKQLKTNNLHGISAGENRKSAEMSGIQRKPPASKRNAAESDGSAG